MSNHVKPAEAAFRSSATEVSDAVANLRKALHRHRFNEIMLLDDESIGLKKAREIIRSFPHGDLSLMRLEIETATKEELGTLEDGIRRGLFPDTGIADVPFAVRQRMVRELDRIQWRLIDPYD